MRAALAVTLAAVVFLVGWLAWDLEQRAVDPLPVKTVKELPREDRIAWTPTVRPTTTLPPTTTTSTQPTHVRLIPKARPAPMGDGRCGGDLPPCSVMQCESGGDPKAENPHSSASGKWQIIDGTWDGYGGYQRASDAPEHVQDEKARELYRNGAGASHWKACA